MIQRLNDFYNSYNFFMSFLGIGKKTNLTSELSQQPVKSKFEENYEENYE